MILFKLPWRKCLFLFLLLLISLSSFVKASTSISELYMRLDEIEGVFERWNVIGKDSIAYLDEVKKENKLLWSGYSVFVGTYTDPEYGANNRRVFYALRNQNIQPVGNAVELYNQLTVRGTYYPISGNSYSFAMFLSNYAGANVGNQRRYLQSWSKDIFWDLNMDIKFLGKTSIRTGLMRPEYNFLTISGYKSSPVDLPWFDYYSKGSEYTGQEMFGMEGTIFDLDKKLKSTFLWGRKNDEEDLYYLKIEAPYKQQKIRGNYSISYQMTNCDKEMYRKIYYWRTPIAYSNEVASFSLFAQFIKPIEISGDFAISSWTQDREKDIGYTFGYGGQVGAKILGSGLLGLSHAITDVKYYYINPNFISVRSKTAATNFYGENGVGGVEKTHAYPGVFTYFDQYVNNRQGLSFSYKSKLIRADNFLRGAGLNFECELLSEIEPSAIYTTTKPNVPIAETLQKFTNGRVGLDYNLNELVSLPFNATAKFLWMGQFIKRDGEFMNDPLNEYGNYTASPKVNYKSNVISFGCNIDFRQLQLEYRYLIGDYKGENIRIDKPEAGYYFLGNKFILDDRYKGHSITGTWRLNNRAWVTLIYKNVFGTGLINNNNLEKSENYLWLSLSTNI